MDTTYPVFEREGVNLFVGASIGRNILTGIRHGYDISRSGNGNVLYLNVVQTNKQLNASIIEVLGPSSDEPREYDPKAPCIFFETIHQGELARRRAEIESYLQYKNVKTIIINSWEFASKNFQYREELLFFLQDLNEGYFESAGATVIIYVQSRKNEPTAGTLQRGGLGKLAAFARKVAILPEAMQFGETKKAEEEARESILEIAVPDIIPIPAELTKMPIHQNGYLPDKGALPNKTWAPILKNDVTDIKGVMGVTPERKKVLVM